MVRSLFKRSCHGIVSAAVPTPSITTFGLLNINGSKVGEIQYRQCVLGLPIDQIGRVNNFPALPLYRQHIWKPARAARCAWWAEATSCGRSTHDLLSAAQKDSQRKAIDDEIASIDAALRRPPTFNLHDPVAYPDGAILPLLLPDVVKLLDP